MYINISRGLKPLYYQLRLTGLLTFKLDDRGNVKNTHSYSLMICGLNAMFTTLCTYLHAHDLFKIYKSLTMYLLSSITIVEGINMIIVDVFRCVNRNSVTNVWKDILLTDNIYLGENITLNYNVILYFVNLTIWAQLILRFVAVNLFISKWELNNTFNVSDIVLVIAYLRNSVATIEFITLRIKIACYFNNFFVLLQKKSFTVKQPKQSKSLLSLYFNLCRLSRNIDRIVSPQFLSKLLETFFMLSILLYNAISQAIYTRMDHLTLSVIFVSYSILDCCLTTTCVILPVHSSIKNVSTCMLLLLSCHCI